MTVKLTAVNDDSSDAQKELREAHKICQRELGNDMRGFILIAWPEDKDEAITAYAAGPIDPDFISEFAKQTVDRAILGYEIELEDEE